MSELLKNMNKTMVWKKLLPILYLLIILFLGGFLRLYRIRDYMGFLGDEGRDVLIVKRMIINHEFTLLGPITSVGLMHLGPIYYYFMAPFLALTSLDPVGPAIMVALFSLATIWLMWRLCTQYISVKAAVISTLLYACSPLAIIYSHSSWNPNILPFWSLLLIYSLLKVKIEKKFIWLFITGLSFGILLQLHYVAAVFLPITLVVLMYNYVKIPARSLLQSVLGVLITFSPFILFEFRHQFINTITIIKFVTRTGDAKTFGAYSFFARFWDLTVRLFWRLVVIENAEISILFVIIIFATCVYLLLRKKVIGDIKKQTLSLLSIWFLVGISLLSFYTGSIFDYYLMFVFPVPFILTGVVFSYFSHNKLGKLIVLIFIVLLLFFELKNTPISKSPNRLASQTQEIAEFILKQTQNEPYNFALLAYKNSDHAYRYFLEIEGQPPVIIKNPNDDPQRKSVAAQLLIVCEEKICQPLGHPLWEIAGFGRAEIAEVSQVGVVKVFKLVHFKEKSG